MIHSLSFLSFAEQFQARCDAKIQQWLERIDRLPADLRQMFAHLISHAAWERWRFCDVIQPHFLEFAVNREFQSLTARYAPWLKVSVKTTFRFAVSNEDESELRSELRLFIRRTQSKLTSKYPGIPNNVWREGIIPQVSRRLQRAGMGKLMTPNYVKTAVSNAAKNALERLSRFVAFPKEFADPDSERAHRAKSQLRKGLLDNGNLLPAEFYLDAFAVNQKNTILFIRAEPRLREALATGLAQPVEAAVTAYVAKLGNWEHAVDLLLQSTQESWDVKRLQRCIRHVLRRR